MTKYVIGPDVALRLAEERATIRDGHRLLAPTLLRSHVLSLLYQAVLRGDLTKKEAHERLNYVRGLPMRLLGDRTLERVAWKIADEHGWPDTFDAEYVALTRLQADALVTLDQRLARRGGRHRDDRTDRGPLLIPVLSRVDAGAKRSRHLHPGTRKETRARGAVPATVPATVLATARRTGATCASQVRSSTSTPAQRSAQPDVGGLADRRLVAGGCSGGRRRCAICTTNDFLGRQTSRSSNGQA